MYAVVGDALPEMTSLRGFTRLHWVILLSTNHPTEMEIAAHQLIKMLFMGASEQAQRKGIDPMKTTYHCFM